MNKITNKKALEEMFFIAKKNNDKPLMIKIKRIIKELNA